MNYTFIAQLYEFLMYTLFLLRSSINYLPTNFYVPRNLGDLCGLYHGTRHEFT
jgi:hypothetical protein